MVSTRYYPAQGLRRLPLKRKYVAAIATALFVFAVSATYYEHHVRVTGPAARPTIELSAFSLITAAHAAQPQLALTSFYLNEDLSSFEARQEPLFSAGKTVTTYAVVIEVQDALKQGKCTGVEGEQPMIAAGSVIKNWLDESNRPELKEYLDSPTALGRLARERGDIFAKIVPSSEELAAIKDKSPKNYAVLKKWILNCVGVYQPVFTATLANTGNKATSIVEVQYDVERVGQVKGAGPSGAIWPELTYDHTLVHSKGIQRFALKPVFLIAAGETKAFNLRLHTKDPRPGLCWYLRVKFVDATGNSVTSERFQLFLNPKDGGRE
jgi:hypothetical protein